MLKRALRARVLQVNYAPRLVRNVSFKQGHDVGQPVTKCEQ